MNAKGRTALIKRNAVEILNENALSSALKKKNLKVYCGYEPSGPIHLGHLVTIMKLLDFQKAGITPIVLLANWHAWLNKKGDWKEIEKEAKSWEKGMKAIGLTKAKFITGTSFQQKADYINDVMTLALNTTVNRGIRSMQTITRDLENAKISQIIYPLMQVSDIKALELDFVVGGLDQRKIHALAIDQFSKIKFTKRPVFIHTGIITSLKGPGEKMSSSIPESMITIRDTKAQIEKKIRKAHCLTGKTDKNPILEIVQLVLFPKFEKIIVKRNKQHGGDLKYDSYHALEKDFKNKKLHPADLKATTAEYLEKLIAPIRKACK